MPNRPVVPNRTVMVVMRGKSAPPQIFHSHRVTFNLDRAITYLLSGEIQPSPAIGPPTPIPESARGLCFFSEPLFMGTSCDPHSINNIKLVIKGLQDRSM